MKKRLVVLTGAGMSAESGLRTFRDADGLWEGYNVMDVATPEAWQADPVLVQKFYNERRKQVLQAKPNTAHLTLAKLEDDFDVRIITQNIDDLHERAGSTQITHLHGIITYSQSDSGSQFTLSNKRR
ncbi:Sir2 family NAD-dependent protein deacetylase [Pedobacter sp. UC225_65]|uniref:Sir2 family NAD-dependent protein deacetylase n=1 Tax=Pedobacter sp. UC225_65 TaxID=3350173 RepID=UPI00366D152D